jgi:hypothetical protein
MIQATRAALFYTLLISGAVYVAKNPVVTVGLWGAATLWWHYVMRYSDHDALAALLFFLALVGILSGLGLAIWDSLL